MGTLGILSRGAPLPDKTVPDELPGRALHILPTPRRQNNCRLCPSFDDHRERRAGGIITWITFVSGCSTPCTMKKREPSRETARP